MRENGIGEAALRYLFVRKMGSRARIPDVEQHLVGEKAEFVRNESGPEEEK